MVVAGVLIKTEPGKTKQVLDKLRAIRGISYALAVFGRYDIVTMIKDVKDLDEAGKFITEKIAKIDGVRATETLIAANI